MLKIECVGEQYGCPFCHKPLFRSGLCGCGASIELLNLSERAEKNKETMTREYANTAIEVVGKVTSAAAKFAPFKKGTARISFFVNTGGIFFCVIAKK